MNTTAPRTVVLGLLALLYTVLLTPLASASSNREWRFEVLLDDKPIGFHTFELSNHGVTRELRGEARFRVKLLGFTVYDFAHRNLELWRDDCLQRIDASTDANGTDMYVRGSVKGEQLVLENNAGNSIVPGCVMTFAYWNPAILSQQRLLNAQTGEYLDVSVQKLGETALPHQGRSVPALHYRLSTAEGDIELWYSSDREWLALSTTTSGGQLRYRRVAAAVGTGKGSDD
jgi:Domain of unknown function (DUF6134)